MSILQKKFRLRCITFCNVVLFWFTCLTKPISNHKNVLISSGLAAIYAAVKEKLPEAEAEDDDVGEEDEEGELEDEYEYEEEEYYDDEEE